MKVKCFENTTFNKVIVDNNNKHNTNTKLNID